MNISTNTDEGWINALRIAQAINADIKLKQDNLMTLWQNTVEDALKYQNLPAENLTYQKYGNDIKT